MKAGILDGWKVSSLVRIMYMILFVFDKTMFSNAAQIG